MIIRHAAIAWGLLSVVAATLALAGPGDPLDGGGCAPLAERHQKCGRVVVSGLANAWRRSASCHLKQATKAATGAAFDEEECEAAALQLLARRPVYCDPEAVRAAAGLAPDLDAFLHQEVSAALFCDATSGIPIDPGGDDPGFVPATRLGLRCANDVGAAFKEAVGGFAACLLKTARVTLRDRRFDEPTCRAREQARYEPRLARARPRCPVCVQTGLADLTAAVVDFVDDHRAALFPCLAGWFFHRDGGLDTTASTDASFAREVVRRVNRDETAVFPTFTSAPFAAAVTFDAAGLAVLHVGANQEMRGCADVRVRVERVASDDSRLPLGTAEATGLTVPQASAKPLLPLGLDVNLAATTVAAGERLAATVELTNRCGGNRALSLDYDAGVTPSRVVLRAP